MSDEFEDMDYDYDEDLFSEEFSTDDIVDSKSDEEILEEFLEDDQPNVIKKDTPENRDGKLVELNDLLNYSEDKRKEKYFRFEWGAEFQVEEDARLQAGFKDFLNAPKISGVQHGYTDANKIPHDKVNKTTNSVQIKDMQESDSDEPESKKFQSHYSTIIINKNSEDEISGIDVICNCGNRTRIEFDYDGNLKYDAINEHNIIIKDPSKDPTVISDVITHHIMESPQNYESDENYTQSLIQELDALYRGGAVNFEGLHLPTIDD